MSRPKVPTPIIDKNGKKTTVHRNSVESSVSGSRIAGLPTIPLNTNDESSNLEHVLRNAKGINIRLRKDLIKAYESKDGIKSVPLLISQNERLINQELLPLLKKLSVDEDYPINDLISEDNSYIAPEYSTTYVEFEDNLRRDVDELREQILTNSDIKADVLEMVADKWIDNNTSLSITKNFYDFKLEIQELSSKAVDPVQKAAFNTALDRIQYYIDN